MQRHEDIIIDVAEPALRAVITMAFMLLCAASWEVVDGECHGSTAADSDGPWVFTHAGQPAARSGHAAEARLLRIPVGTSAPAAVAQEHVVVAAARACALGAREAFLRVGVDALPAVLLEAAVPVHLRVRAPRALVIGHHSRLCLLSAMLMVVVCGRGCDRGGDGRSRLRWAQLLLSHTRSSIRLRHRGVHINAWLFDGARLFGIIGVLAVPQPPALRRRQSRDDALFRHLLSRDATLQPALALDRAIETRILHPGPGAAARVLLALLAADLWSRDVVQRQAPRIRAHVVDADLKLATCGMRPVLLEQPVQVQRLQAVCVILLVSDVEVPYQGVVTEPEHTKRHLRAALVVADLELEEGDAQQHRGRIPRDAEHALEVAPLVQHLRRVVLADENGHGGELFVVVVLEEPADVRRGVRRVDAVEEALLVHLPEVVLRVVADHLHGVPHGLPELQHLPHRGLVAEPFALRADAEGEGCREVDQRPTDAGLLLRIQQAVQGGHEGAAEGLRPSSDLQVRLVHEDQCPQSRAVHVADGHEAPLQVHHVRFPDLAVAVEPSALAAPCHLGVGVVADPRNDIQSLVHGLIKEATMVQGRIIAIEPHRVGADGLHDGQVVAALRPPEHCGVRRHEVVVIQHAHRPERHGCVADALDQLLPVRSVSACGSGRAAVGLQLDGFSSRMRGLLNLVHRDALTSATQALWHELLLALAHCTAESSPSLDKVGLGGMCLQARTEAFVAEKHVGTAAARLRAGAGRVAPRPRQRVHVDQFWAMVHEAA
mmetsp:Transcript_33650/g.86127  ORF Transcript_33650/g.86127 Transcript_33650/m.86127 type:complete len:774 (+) Transcript_33650:97-2418(+)